MGFCKENEICKPSACKKSDCIAGEMIRKELKEKFKTPQECGGTCSWTNNGINGINNCKKPCEIGATIVWIRKNITLEKR